MCRNNMGLGGVEQMENLKRYTGYPNPLEVDMFSVSATELDICTSKLAALGTGDNSNVDSQLLMQAQVLLNKSRLYQKIDESTRCLWFFQPNVFSNLPHGSNEKDKVTSLHRDAAVNNLRFINIFYGYGPKTFALAVNLLDRLLGKVKAHPKYLSCIATCCFYIAAKTQQDDVFIPNATELVKLSQCGGTVSDLVRMEKLILDKLSWELNAVTPLTFLQLFYEVFAARDARMADQAILNSIVGKLEVIMCQFEFTQYRADLLALALLSYELQELGILSNADQFNTVVELQYYCQMPDCDFLHCRGMVMDYLRIYKSQPSKLPRLQLTWTVSRRTLNKMKPSTRILLDLEPIMEDEDDPDSDDAGPFDSENDDVDMAKSDFAGGSLEVPMKQPILEISHRSGNTCPMEDKRTELSFMLHSENEAV